ncbi:MAG: hypothetical protein ACI87E_002519 [Mariniblastus sp.]|jgi:hypothetical protein
MVTSSNVGRIPEERGLGGEEQAVTEPGCLPISFSGLSREMHVKCM